MSAPLPTLRERVMRTNRERRERDLLQLLRKMGAVGTCGVSSWDVVCRLGGSRTDKLLLRSVCARLRVARDRGLVRGWYGSDDLRLWALTDRGER